MSSRLCCVYGVFSMNMMDLFIYLGIVKKEFLYLLLEREREGEREGNISVWLPVTDALLGTWPTIQECANWESNQ